MTSTYTHRTAQGVWINDMRNRALPRQQWPCVTLDDRAERDLKGSMRLQAASGFDSVTLFGLLTASSWRPKIDQTVSDERRQRVDRLLQAAHDCGLKVLYGLGVYSWGFDDIIASDAAVAGPNPRAMCGSRVESRRWMRRVVDYLLETFDFDGFHLEASDLGRCTCAECAGESNTAYYSRVNAETAAYIRSARADSVLMVNMCGYLPWGEEVPRDEWRHLTALGEHLDFLVDPGLAGYFIEPESRSQFTEALGCAFGSAGGIWVYPPQRWQRQRWFVPYTQRTGQYLSDLYDQGGRAVEYYMGPAHNPGVEVNIAFGGRKLCDVERDSGDLLEEVLEELYQPLDGAARTGMARLFIEAEEAFFASYDPLLPAHGKPRGEIHLTPLIGVSPGPPIYLTETMTASGRRAYGLRLRGLLAELEGLVPRLRSRQRPQRIKACIEGALRDLGRLSATPPAKGVQ